MNEVLPLAFASAAGILLGAFFFGGLWWTVRRGATSEWPVLWFSGSLALRMGFTLTGFYFVGQEHWERWLLCLLGFCVARLVAGLLIRLSGTNQADAERQASYAP